MKRALVCLLILLLCSGTSQAQRRRNTQDPQTQAQRRAAQQQRAAQRAEQQTNQAASLPSAGKKVQLALLPPPETLTDGDAYPLYQEAAGLLPADAVKAIGQEWTRMKPADRPLDQVRQVLQQCQPALNLVEKATLCRSCNWPAVQPGAVFDLTSYRHFSRLLYLRAGVALAENRPADAVRTFQTAFAVARHLGTGPGLMAPLVGAADAGLTCRAVHAYAELPGAPSLYEAIASLPRPFIDVEKQCKAEIDALDTNPTVNTLNRGLFLEQLKTGTDRVRQLARRTDRDLAAVQCLEAIRLYVTETQGTLPQSLDEIKVSVPQDALNAKPFEYTCTSKQAALSSPAPKGDSPNAALRYEIAAAKTGQGVRFTVNRIESK